MRIINTFYVDEKKALRREIKKRIAGFSAEYLAESDAAVCENFLLLPELKESKRVLLYASSGREVSTKPLEDTLYKAGKQLAFPACEGNGIMRFKLLSQGKSKVSAMYGLEEPPPDAPELIPEKNDIIVVPALSFSRGGYRLGMGGGYYDRFLYKYPKLLSVGFAREELILKSVPVETHDIRVDIIVSDKRLRDFRNGSLASF